MNHRERVEAALRHCEPDRVPIDLWGSASRIHTDLYFSIVDYLGLDGLGDRVRPGTTCEYVDYRISDIIDADFRHLVIGRPCNFSKYTDEDGNVIDEWGVGRKPVGGYWQITRYPLRYATAGDLDRYRWPIIPDPGRIDGLAEQARRWHEETDYAITATSAVSGLVLELCQYLRGDEQFLLDLHLDPHFAHKLIDKVTDVLIELHVYYITPLAPYLHWVEYTSDFGTQTGPLISRSTFRRFFLEPHRRIFSAVKRVAPNARTFLHSCGSVRMLIPEFIESGVEILNSLQPLCRGMDSRELKAEFGRDLVFHGGVDLQRALRGSVEETSADTRQRIAAFGPGGGYICAPSNHFQPDVPVVNFLALYQTALDYGRYPLQPA